MTSASCLGTVRVFVLVPARIDKRGLADEYSDLASSFLNVSLTAVRAYENIPDGNYCIAKIAVWLGRIILLSTCGDRQRVPTIHLD